MSQMGLTGAIMLDLTTWCLNEYHVGIPMGMNCAPLLTDPSLYSCKIELIQKLLNSGRKIHLLWSST